MRKAIYVSILVSLVLLFGLFVSCSNEVRVEESTAIVSFGKIDGERALSSSVGIPGAEDLFWKVKAAKKDSGLNTGAGEHNLGNGSKGISNDVKITLSVGQWEFTLSGYTDSSMTEESKIYEGKKTETLYKNDSKNINVEVVFCGGTNGSGRVELSGVLLSNASSSVADKLLVEVFKADDEMITEKLVTSTTFNKDTSNKFSGEIQSRESVAELTPGVYKFRFTLQNDNMSSVTSLTRYVVVLQGRTTTIAGDLSEDQVNLTFSVTILKDEYSQFGKYFYVLVNSESAYQKALQKAAEYTGEESAVVILSDDLTVDTTVISSSSSRAIDIGMTSSSIIIDLNGHELKLKDGASSDVLISLDAPDKAITIMDSSSNGTINASSGIAFDVKNGKLDIQSGIVEASVIIKISSNSASVSVSGGTLNASGSIISKADSVEGADVDISGADIVSGASTLGFASGSGTESDPYLISNVDEFKALSNCVNQGMTFENKFVKLSEDIDLKNDPWTPIGGPKKSMLDRYKIDNSFLYKFTEDDYNTFAGTFDGDSHTISNLKVSNSSTITNGLFGAVANGAVIKNLTINNADIDGIFFVGTLVGYIPSETSTPSEYTVIENVKIEGNVTVNGYFSFGGMVGRSEVKSLLKLKNSSISASETSKVETKEGGFMVGGLVGVSYGFDTIIDSSSSNIDVNGRIQSVGGFVGHMEDGEIINSTVSGDVTLNGKDEAWPYDHYGVGAFVGTVDSTAIAGRTSAPVKTNNSILIKNCSATGTVSAEVNENEPLFFNGLVGTIRSTTKTTYIGVSPENIVSVVLEKEINSQSDLNELNLNTKSNTDRFMNGTSSIILKLKTDVSLDVSDAYFQFGGLWTDLVEIRGNGHRIDLDTNYWSRLSMKNGEGKLVIKDAVMDSSQQSGTWDSYDVTFRDIRDLELTNVSFEKAVAINNVKHAVLDKVNITEKDNAYYALWITAGSGVTIKNSEIRGTFASTSDAARAIKVSDQYVGDNDSSSNPPYGVEKTTLNIYDSTIEGRKKSAVLLGTIGGADITMTNVTSIVGDKWNTETYKFISVDDGDSKMENGSSSVNRGTYISYNDKNQVAIDGTNVTPGIEP